MVCTYRNRCIREFNGSSETHFLSDSIRNSSDLQIVNPFAGISADPDFRMPRQIVLRRLRVAGGFVSSYV